MGFCHFFQILRCIHHHAFFLPPPPWIMSPHCRDQGGIRQTLCNCTDEVSATDSPCPSLSPPLLTSGRDGSLHANSRTTTPPQSQSWKNSPGRSCWVLHAAPAKTCCVLLSLSLSLPLSPLPLATTPSLALPLATTHSNPTCEDILCCTPLTLTLTTTLTH
jgi:hypothetical protein